MLAALLVVSPVLGQVQAAIQRGMAAGGGIQQEDADLAVVLLAQAAAPLTLDAAGVAALLGKGAGIDNQDGGRVSQFLLGVASQLSQEGVVVPLACADEVLHGLARSASLESDGFAGLALQAAETPSNHDGGQLALFVAIEQRQVALQEAGQVVAAAGNRTRGQGGVVEQAPPWDVQEDWTWMPLAKDAPASNYPWDEGVAMKKGYSRTR